MSRLLTFGFEAADERMEPSGSFGDTNIGNSTGTVSIDTAIKRSGNSSLKVAGKNAAPSSGFLYQFPGGSPVADRTYWARFAFYVSALPPAGVTQTMFEWGIAVVQLRVASSGQITLRSNATLPTTITGPTIVAGTWYVAQIGIRIGTGSVDYQELWIDNVSYGSNNNIAITDSISSIDLQFTNGVAAQAGSDFYFDDFALNDNQGSWENNRPSWRGRVALQLPVSDTAQGSDWKEANNTALAAAWQSLDNTPVAGSGVSDNTVGHRIRDAIANITEPNSAVDVTTQTYDSLLPAGAEVRLVHPFVWFGGEANNTRTIKLRSVSNPVDDGTGVSGSGTGNTSIFPTNWNVGRGMPVDGASVNKSLGARLRIVKQNNDTNVLSAGFLGQYVEYIVPEKVEVKRGSFIANVATGNQQITGLGFKPAGIVFQSMGLTAVGDAAGPSGQTDPMGMFGAASGPSNQWAISYAARDAIVSDTAGGYTNVSCIAFDASLPAHDAAAALVSMDNDGFTINWTNAPSAALLIEYWAIGGSDAKAFAFSDQVRTTTGDEQLTGFGFQPKLLIDSSFGLHLANPNTGPTATTLNYGIGVASSPTQRGSIGVSHSDGSNPTNVAVMQMQRALAVAQAGGLDWHIDVKTFDSDGITYTVTDAPTGANADWWFGLAIGGTDLRAAVVDDTQKTSTGTKATTGLGFKPKGFLCMSLQHATAFDSAAVTDQPARQVIGFADETSEACTWWGTEDNVNPADVDRSHSQSKFIQYRNNSRTVLAEATISSRDGDGLTLNWTTADGTGRQFILLSVGQTLPTDLTASAAATSGAQAGDMNWGEKRSDAVSSGGQSPFVGVLQGLSDAVSTATVVGMDILLTATADAELDVDARLAMPTATGEAEAGDGFSNVATMYLLHGTSHAGNYPFHLQPLPGFYILSSPPALGVSGAPVLGEAAGAGNASMFFALAFAEGFAELAHFSFLGESEGFANADPARISLAAESDAEGMAVVSPPTAFMLATLMTASSAAVSSASILEVLFRAPDVSAPRIYRRIIVPLYEFWLCESPDPRTPLVPLEKIASLDDATQRNFTIVKNRPGSISFRVPLEGPSAEQIYRRQDNRGTVRSAVKVRRKGRDGFWRTMHSGPIWTIQGDAEGDNLVVNCVGWQATTANRRLREEPTSVFNAPIDQIIFAVMDIINAQDPNGRDLLIDKGQVYGSPITIRIPLQKDQNLNQIMLQFSDVEGGVDLVIDPDTRKLDIYNWDQVLTKDVHLGYNWGPNNLANFTWAENTQQWVDYLEVIGGDKTRAVVDDEEAMDEFGVSDQVISRPEIIGTKALQTLLGYAGAEVAIRARPFLTYTIFPKKISPEDEHAIRLFDDFDVGDKIYWSARKGPIRVTKQQIRLFGASVNVDDEGNEDIQNMQITAESLG